MKNIETLRSLRSTLSRKRAADSLTLEEAGVLADDYFGVVGSTTDIGVVIKLVTAQKWGFSILQGAGDLICTAKIMLPPNKPEGRITDGDSWSKSFMGSGGWCEMARALLGAFVEGLIYTHCLTEPVTSKEQAWIDSDVEDGKNRFEQTSRMFDYTPADGEENFIMNLRKEALAKIIQRRMQ